MELEDVLRLIAGGESESVEFKEDSPSTWKKLAREICAFANSNGGVILIGVSDKGEIKGIKTKDFEKKLSDVLLSIEPAPKINYRLFDFDGRKILAIEVKKSPSLCSVGNVAYIRIGKNLRALSVDEVALRKIEERKVYFDLEPCRECSFDELKTELIEELMQGFEERWGKKLWKSAEEFLIKARLAKKIGNKLIPTNAGVLLLHENPELFIPGAYTIFVEFEKSPREFRDMKEFRGPLIEQVREITSFLSSRIRKIGKIAGLLREEIYEYPVTAVREAVINALVHRNYYSATPTYIFYSPFELTVKNPGPLPAELDLNNPTHIPRNPALCDAFWALRFIEKFGTGIVAMREECEKHPLVDFSITSTKFETVVRFRKNKLEFLDDVSKKILDILNRPMRSSEIAKALNLSKPPVIKRLKMLEKLGLISAEGSGNRLRYFRKLP